MPELPEVETTRRGIEPYLLGQTILHTTVYNHKLRWPVDEAIHSLSQAKVSAVKRRGKYLLIETNQSDLLLHLGMSGSLRICDTGSELRKHDHVVFHLGDSLELRFHDPRRFGCILENKDGLHHSLLRKLGPEPFSDDFTLPYFLESCRASSSAIKPHLMKNTTVVGVGNIYACESLFSAGIHPARPANAISAKRLETLYHVILRTLRAAIEQGGTTLRDFVNQDGSPGYFQQQLFVYGRESERCKQCHSSIKKITQAQRSTFYCGRCQR